MEGLVEFLREKYPPVAEQKLNGVYSQPQWWRKNASLEYYDYKTSPNYGKNLWFGWV